MIKDFITYINEGLFDRNQSEFNIKKTGKGIEQVYIPKDKDELYKYIELDIDRAKKEGTYPNVNLNNIDVSEIDVEEICDLFGADGYHNKGFNINPDISEWDIEHIGYQWFAKNTRIESFVVPNSVKVIDDTAFYWCTNLTSITLPDTLKVIRSNAFYGCENLTSIDIPNGVEEIESGVFIKCKSLSSVTIPRSVTSIGVLAFDECMSMTSIDVASDNPTYHSEDGILFNKNIDTIVKYPCGKEGDAYIIPDTVTQLADWSFAGCVNLKSIIIPDSVEVIGDGAFCGCENLTSIVIPSSVKSFGDRCFLACDSLTSATVPKGFPRNCRPKNKLIERPFPRWCEVKEV
jgi:hypothetical protein